MSSVTIGQFGCALLGAVLNEVLHWYRLRSRLDSAKYRKMLRSLPYWIVTALFILLGSVVVPIYFAGRLTAGELIIAGAAAPAILTKLVAAFKDSALKLGSESDRTDVLEYFEYA